MLKMTRANNGSDLAIKNRMDYSPIIQGKYDLKVRPDRIGKYLKKHLDDFVFDQFSENFIQSQKKLEFMNGVPIPLRKEDLEDFKGGSGIKLMHLVSNMAWVMGVDPRFKYADAYLAFMKKNFNSKLAEGFVKAGRNHAEKESFDEAVIYFRSALCVNPMSLDAMYSYARACREIYLRSNNEEKTGHFKAESMEYFELLVEAHPKFAQAYYYLGYAYLNLGLYVKAQLTWQDFVAKTMNRKDRNEIKQRLEQIKEPVEIEKGCNEVLATRWVEGLNILEPYMSTKFKDWWPMSYYLGVAYSNLGRKGEATNSFKRVLSLCPSHVESMDELADIYRDSKDKENEMKYRKKAELIRSGGHKER